MRKYARTFDGRTYLYSRKFNDKTNAATYAQKVRQHGYNARVVNWAGGSGVYIGNRKYSKTIDEARNDWLYDIRIQSGDESGMVLGNMGFQAVPRIRNVGGDIREARDVISRISKVLPDSKYMSTMDKVSTIDEAFSGVGNWTPDQLISILTKDNDFLAGQETTDEEALKIQAVLNLQRKRNEGVTPGDTLYFLGEDDVDLFTLLSAVEENKPIIVNEKGQGTASQFEIGGPKRTGRPGSMLGWGIDPNEGKGRFGMNSNRLARWHVVINYPTKDGYEERPLYGFDTEQKAIEFAKQFEQLGEIRGEYFMNAGSKTSLFLPFETTNVSIVKEYATEEDMAKQDRLDSNNMSSKLNLPPEYDGPMKSNVPGQSTVLELIRSQKSQNFYENYSEIIGLIMYNAGFGIKPSENFGYMMGSGVEDPEFDTENGYSAALIEDWVGENFTEEEITNFTGPPEGFLEGLRIKRGG